MGRTQRQQTGDAAEEQARRHLAAEGGHHCLAQNFHARGGELDLVTLEGEVLVFVEVRARSGTDFGAPEETIGHRKRGRLVQAAQAFLRRYPQHSHRFCRFDVVAVDDNGLRWIPDAFQPDQSGFWS